MLNAESVIEYMLYALWDLGFKVGHASRTVDECVKLARADFTIRTALLEARRLTGDDSLKNEGKVDRASGAVKDKVGDAADKVKGAMRDD